MHLLAKPYREDEDNYGLIIRIFMIGVLRRDLGPDPP
jgi:hypothetical protein